MSKFCKKCGAALEEGAGFCESCGAPVAAIAKDESAARPVEVAEQSSLSRGKLLMGVGGGFAVLLLLVAGVWFLTGAPGKPSEASLSALLNADSGFKSRTVCLGNFSYDHNDVNINTNDQDSQQWFGILVNAGLYSAPRIVNTGGWYSRELYQYTPTEKGKLAIQNGKLCFAQGVVLDKVTYGEVQQVQNKSYATAEYTYHFLNADEWIKRPEAQALAAGQIGQETMTGNLVVERTDKEWTVSAIPVDSLAIAVAARQVQSMPSDSASAGFLAGLTNLLSGFSGNPLIGKWRNDISGEVVEFTANKIIGTRGGLGVSYEIDGNKVKVRNKDMPGESNCTVLDKSHMTWVDGNLLYKFTRINN